MNGWRMAQIAPMGLYETTNGNVKQYMTAEDYAFWYEGVGSRRRFDGTSAAHDQRLG